MDEGDIDKSSRGDRKNHASPDATTAQPHQKRRQQNARNDEAKRRHDKDRDHDGRQQAWRERWQPTVVGVVRRNSFESGSSAATGISA